MPAISIIVPVYKIEKYISECVQSLLKQTFSDIEIILVDDGSPDRCGEICDAYSRKDARVRVIHQSNAGLSIARNNGVSSSTGQYICFVDGDDYVAPEFCETLLSLLRDSDCDFSACGVCRFMDGCVPKPTASGEIIEHLNNKEYLRDQLSKSKEFGVWNRMYRRELFDTIRFCPGLVHEDVYFSAELSSLHGGVICTSAQLYFYRQRKTGIVAETNKKISPDWLIAGEHLINCSRSSYPDLTEKCLVYAVRYPWSYVDKIYVDRKWKDNREFLQRFQRFLRKYRAAILSADEWDPITRNRMRLFTKSKILYGFNAYSRLLRVYVYHLLGKDAYADGHGI